MHRKYVSQSAAAHAGALQLYTLLPAAADVVTSMQTKCNSERLQKFLTRIKSKPPEMHMYKIFTTDGICTFLQEDSFSCSN
jgi:hypothetical protein